MLAVWINKANFEYDVHSIVKAFYPEETVKVITPETKEEKKNELADRICLEILFEEDGAGLKTEGLQDLKESEGGSGAKELFWKWDRTSGDTYKDCFKRFLYESLKQMTGQTLPWGNLTGIRPTKIPYGMLEKAGCTGECDSKTKEEILRFMEEKHFVSPQKSRLSLDIAQREMEILKDIHYEDGYSLYIGIPFCPTTCLYCSFTSFAIGAYRKQVDAYIDCLIREMDDVSGSMKHKILDSVYIGGGTPTTLEAHQLDRLLGALKEKFDFAHVKEFTVEAGRADSITEEKLEVLYRHGVGRISINPQTMKQETLDLIGRRHTVEQVIDAYRLARKIGFDNINMDLILGLPGETEEDVRNTIERVTDLAPESLTVHSLAIKRASRLSQWIQEHGVDTLRNTDKTMEIAAKGAQAMGMKPYYLYRQKNMSGNFENVGYARPGKYGLYNILIMEEKQTIVALGAGSITKRVFPEGRIERCDNVKDVALYIEKIDEMTERKRALLEE